MFIRYRISWLQKKFHIYFLMDNIWKIFYLVLHCWVISITDLFMYYMLYMCIRGCTRLCMSIWRPDVYVRDHLQSLFIIFFKTEYFTEPGTLIFSDWLIGESPNLPAQCCALQCLDLCERWRSRFKFSCLHGRPFFNWAISISNSFKSYKNKTKEIPITKNFLFKSYVQNC